MSRAYIALSLYTAWMTFAFGVRTWLHWRKTGSSGFKGISGAVGSLEWVAGVMFVAALLGGFVGALLHGSGAAVDFLQQPGLLAAGIIISVAGALATLFAQAAMGTSWRIGVDRAEQTDLVTGGIFQVARNPIFTAMAVTASGLALVVPTLVTLVSLAMLVVALEIQVRLVEEPYLRLQHGEEYLSYARRVGRFVPGIGRLDE